MFKYWGFGHCILSQIKFPELCPFEFVDSDITIVIGKVPETVKSEDFIRRKFSEINDCEYLLNIEGICKYYASNGNKIIIEPVRGIDVKSVRLFLLDTVMAAILYQRECLPLRASAIIKEGKLILFSGHYGVGKSTVASLFVKKGFPIFTDDICILKYCDNEIKATFGSSSYPMVKVWSDAITLLNSDLFLRKYRIRPDLPIFGYFFHNTYKFDPIEIDKVFILHADVSAQKLTIDHLSSIEAYRKIEKEVNKKFLQVDKKNRIIRTAILSHMVNHTPIYSVTYPLFNNDISKVVDVLADFL